MPAISATHSTSSSCRSSRPRQGLSESQAQCAIDALEESVTDDDLQAAIEEAAQTGEPPQDLIDAGFDAGQQCADE